MKWITGLATAMLSCVAVGQVQAASWVEKPSLSDEFNSWSVNTALWRVYHNEIRKPDYQWDNVIWHNSMVKPTEAKLLIQSEAHSGYVANAVDDAWDTNRTYQYRAGGIVSKNTFGPNTAISARVKLSKNLSGNSFSFWLTGANDVWPPELDVFEFPRGKFPSGNKYVATSHYGTSWEAKGHDPKTVSVTETEWNLYKITWTPSAVAWTLNGVEVHRVSGSGDIFNRATPRQKVGTYSKVPTQQMNVIINSAVGKNDPDWFGNPTHDPVNWKCEMQVDWFRVAKYE
jgi:beta-glucanase (GH16 family)